jgi:outer membrane protein assembly factor BamB
LGDIDVDVWGNIFVTDIGLTFGPVQVVQITPSTGDRRTVTSDTVGSGPQLRVPWPIAVDHDRNILVIDSNSVLRVGPETGDRSIVSGLGTGEGPSFIEPKGLAVADNGDIFVADDDDDDAPRPVILQVDPQTGDRNLVSGEGVGSGPLLGSLVELAFDDSGQLLVLAADRILRVDPITGDRELFSGDSLGSGPTGFGGIAVGYDGTVYVAAGDPSFVMRVDPATGDRIIVSANTHGSGPDFGTFGGIAIVPLLIPEPSSLALAAWCISFMACLRRHYRRLSVSVGGVIKAL